MPSFAFNAVLAEEVFTDTFTRTNASDWGPDYQIDFVGSGGTLSVDGSVGRLTANKSTDLALLGDNRIAAGAVYFDFFVPADLSDSNALVSILTGAEYPLFFDFYRISSTTWQVDVSEFYETSVCEYTFTPTASTWYRVKGTWAGFANGPTTVKVWKASDPEPADAMAVGEIGPPEDALTDPDDWFESFELSMGAPRLEVMGFDNLRTLTFGTIQNPTTQDSFDFDAVIKGSRSGTVPFDAVIAPLRFTLDAWTVGSRLKHDRQVDHFGTELDTVIAIDGAIGKYPSGELLHDVLADMVARITALEDGNHVVASPFTLNAFIAGWIGLNAVIFRSGSAATFTLDAIVGQGGTFALDAYLLGHGSSSFTFAAYLIDSPNGTWTTSNATPAPNGANTIFGVGQGYAQGSTTVYLDGVPQVLGVDYIELDDVAGTIQFTTPPGPGTTIIVHFRACG